VGAEGLRVDLADVTPFVLTLDEEPNIDRALDGLRWAPRVLVVDSGSSDGTLEIARRYSNVEVRTRAFDSFAGQSNHALAAVATTWAMALDADYVVPPALVAEIAGLPNDPAENGFEVPFRYVVLGRALRGSLYPPRAILFRARAGVFEQDGHAHRVRIPAPVGRLRTAVDHDDRKSLGRWLRSQAVYADQEAEKLSATPFRELGWADRLRRTALLGPPAVAVHCLFARGLVFDGRAGWYYSAQRAVAESILSLRLLETRRKRP
jgi:glycosyltransferase involved in cell wall biosynthesis